jgi:hypothetical protein
MRYRDVGAQRSVEAILKPLRDHPERLMEFVAAVMTIAEAAATTNAVPAECRLCGEPLLVRRRGRDTCARHPEVRDDMVGLPPA